MIALRQALSAGLLLVALAACDQQDHQHTQNQRYYFLQALEQVDSGGRRLQAPGLDQGELSAALAQLDEGLGLAFRVERDFLDELDLRLGKNFERYFIKGVENYRLGIEAGDREQQIEGLRLLRKWAEFWNAEKAAIEARLNTG